MKLSRLKSFCAGAVLLTCSCAPALADLTITMHSTFNSPMIQNSPQMQSALAPYQSSTEYISGSHIRIDTAGVSAILDSSAHKAFALNKTEKTYSVMDLSPAMVNQMLAGGPVQSLGISAGTTYNLTDTGKTSQLLGHKVHEYTISSSIPMGQTGTLTINADIFAAQDFPAQDMAAYNSLNSMTPGTTHIQGIPLQTTTTISGLPIGNMTIKQVATAISATPVDSSLFAVPSGYTQTQIPPAAPGVEGGGAPAQ